MVSGGSLTRVQSWDIITSKDRVQHMGLLCIGHGCQVNVLY